MTKNLMFIHGMFMTPQSWEPWRRAFEAEGYDCVAPAWPFHDGEPQALRANPPQGLGALSLATVVDAMAEAAAPFGGDVILVGHSVGGLVVQLLAARGIGTLGVPICSVAPNRMLAMDWGFFRNSMAITNPLKGDDPFPMDADGFFANFGNAMTREASDAAWRREAVNDSRNVLRDCMGTTGEIDMDRPHVPFLFVGAAEDEIVPSTLCARNAAAYTDRESRADYIEFAKRGHFICGEDGWDEVAAYVANWIKGKDSTSAHVVRTSMQ